MKKVLIIKLGAIGDVIMALPMIETIRNTEKEAYIVWVCGKTVSPILSQFPVDKLIVVDDKKILNGNLWQKILEVIKVWFKLGNSSYEKIYMCYSARRYNLLTLFTRCKSFRKLSTNGSRPSLIAGRWFSDEYVRLVTGIDQNANCATMPVRIPSRIQESVEAIITKLGEGRKIVLSPGGIKDAQIDRKWCRRWPVENYRDLVVLLREQGMQIILSGGKDDLWVADNFDDGVVNLIGKLNLLETIAMYQQVDLVITHDSGAIHLAGIAGTPVIGLFGPTNPHTFMPKGLFNKYIWDVDRYACCPCYDGRNYADCKENICMKNILPQRVLAEALMLMEKSGHK